MTRKELETGDRDTLVKYLEGRGFAVYDFESNFVLLAAALQDWDEAQKERKI